MHARVIATADNIVWVAFSADINAALSQPCRHCGWMHIQHIRSTDAVNPAFACSTFAPELPKQPTAT